MKRLLLLLALGVAWPSMGQPILRSSFTTNALHPELVYDPTTRRITLTIPAGGAAGGIILQSNLAIKINLNGANGDILLRNLNASTSTVTEAQSDRLLILAPGNEKLLRTDASGYVDDVTIGTGLLFDGAALSANPVGPAGETNFYDFTFITNLFFVSGKGNSLVVTQTLTVSGGFVYPLVPGTNITFTTNTLGAGLTNLTINSSGGSGGGDTTSTNIVLLSQTGTNASQMDFSLVTYGGVFKLALTNNAYFGTPANVDNTSFKKAWLMVQQPSTGTCLVTFTNGWYAWAEGAQPINDTNNGSVSVYEFVSDVFTNGIVHGSMTPLSRLP